MPQRQLALLFLIASLALVFAGTCSLMAWEVPIPKEVSEIPSVGRAELEQYRYTPGFYRALLTHDARAYGLANFDPDSLVEPNRFQSEFRGRYVFKKSSKPLDTEHLSILAEVEKVWIEQAQGDARFRTEQVNLRIQNRTDRYLAFFVGTGVTDANRCSSMGSQPANGITLGPKETLVRSECLYQPAFELWVERVDVMEISSLGYYYVARLTPNVLGMDPRIAEQHRLPKGTAVCRHVPQNELAVAGSPEARWPVVVDFYSRHNCDEYWFFGSYRRREEAMEKLEAARP